MSITPFWIVAAIGVALGGLTNTFFYHVGLGGVESWVISFMVGVGFIVEKMRWDGP